MVVKNNNFVIKNIIFNFFPFRVINQNKILKLSQKILFVIILAPVLLFSQNFETKRTKSIIIKKMEFRIDSFSIISNTLSIKHKDDNQFIPENKYILNEIESRIQIKDTLLIGDTLLFNYSVFPVLLSRTFYNRKLNFIEPQ